MPAADYARGLNTIVYRSDNFATGLVVTTRVWDPDAVEDAGSPFTLTEMSFGLYQFSYTFGSYGIYHMIVFEGGTATVYSPLRVGTKASI